MVRKGGRERYALALLCLLVCFACAAANKHPKKQKGPRMDARVAVQGENTKEKVPKKEAIFSADLKKGRVVEASPDAYPGLSQYQRGKLQCRDSMGNMHKLAAKYLVFGAECTYYECEYYPEVNGATWVLNRDIFKCCFMDDFGYKDGSTLEGTCTKKVCEKGGDDNDVEDALAWSTKETGCGRCTIGLVMMEQGEIFHIGDECLHFKCSANGKLVPQQNPQCCTVNDTLVAPGQLAMTRVDDVCEVATCSDGTFTNHTNYQPLITKDDYISGCPVHWSNIQGVCYMSFTKPLTYLQAVRACSELSPARNSQVMMVDFGGMIGTMEDLMELGRWYWLKLRTRPDTPRRMWDNISTPERFLVGDEHPPVVKKVNKYGKLAFQAAPATLKKAAYVCQMDHKPSCKPTGYTEPPPIQPGKDRFEEL